MRKEISPEISYESSEGLDRLLKAIGAKDLEDLLTNPAYQNEWNKIKGWVRSTAFEKNIANPDEVVKEVLQEVFKALLEKKRINYEQKEGLTPWSYIMAMAKRQTMVEGNKFHRYKKRSATLTAISPEGEERDFVPDLRANALESLIDNEETELKNLTTKKQYELVLKAIDSLDDKYRKTLYASFPNGWDNESISNEEASKALGVSLTTFVDNLRRAKEIVKHNLRFSGENFDINKIVDQLNPEQKNVFHALYPNGFYKKPSSNKEVAQALGISSSMAAKNIGIIKDLIEKELKTVANNPALE